MAGPLRGAGLPVLIAACLLVAVSAPGRAQEAWTTPAVPAPLTAATDLFDAEERSLGPLEVRAFAAAAEGGDEAEALRLAIEARVSAFGTASAGELELAVVLLSLEGETDVWTSPTRVAVAEGEASWVLRATIEAPEDFAEAAVFVAGPGPGSWGVARVQLGSAAPPPARVVDLGGAAAEAPAAPLTVETPSGGEILQLLPPAKSPAVGRVRFRAVTASSEVARVVFLLDGEERATDERAPFSQVLDVGTSGEPFDLTAVAYSGGGRELARDTIRLNQTVAFDVRVAVAGGAASRRATAEVLVPAGRTLEAVELYWNDTLLARRTEAPYEAAVPEDATEETDFVRALAILDDGSQLDDVTFLAVGAAADRVDVNLVEVYAVVTDRSGEPVLDLTQEDFDLRRAGRPVAIERFRPADEVPLALGLVVDTSESMWPLMPDTKRAGAEFLVSIFEEGDAAFLIDFDSRPRLAQGLTSELRDILLQFGSLEAGGLTALYDAILFAMLQFEQGPQRRALVVLTDGDDVKSRYTARRCVQVGRELGVPVYILDLSSVRARSNGYRWAAPGAPRLDLDGITASTGGRLFFVHDLDELSDAYRRINEELRSQYLLAFVTDRPLSGDELREVEVDVRGRRLRVRSVVGAG